MKSCPILLDFFTLCQIFWPGLLISNIKNFVYELPHKLLNDLRLKILENQEYQQYLKLGWRWSLVPSLPCRNNYLVIATKNYVQKVSCPISFDFFTWSNDFFFVCDCLLKHIFPHNLSQSFWNFNALIFSELQSLSENLIQI